MNDSDSPGEDYNQHNEDQPPDPESASHQQVQVPGVTARVPVQVGRGVMSTGAIVMNGPHSFVVDFLQQMGVPGQLVCRIVLPHAVIPRFVEALEQNLGMYEQKFGPPPKLPKPPPGTPRPSAQEIYENLKLPDEELGGHFADGVMIRHSAAEFCFDFVTHFFPHAAVSGRVFLSRPMYLRCWRPCARTTRSSGKPRIAGNRRPTCRRREFTPGSIEARGRRETRRSSRHRGGSSGRSDSRLVSTIREFRT